jgi:hypothetical protein
VNIFDLLGLADINKFPPAEKIHKYGNKYKRWFRFTVAAHGNSALIVDKNGAAVSAKNLAAEIIAHPKYKKGQTV